MDVERGTWDVHMHTHMVLMWLKQETNKNNFEIDWDHDEEREKVTHLLYTARVYRSSQKVVHVAQVHIYYLFIEM